MTLNNAQTALFQAHLLYGVELNEDDFEEMFLIVHRMIGNKYTRLYHEVANIDPVTLTVELPCNCDIIEAVTYNWEDWNYTSNTKINGDLGSSYVEQYIESRKMLTDPLYLPGKFAEYHRVGNSLQFKHPGKVHILYKGEILDDDGLPQINDKEVLAIATYIAYIVTYKEGLMTKNSNTLNLANLLKQQANVLMDLARTPEYLNQNDLDEILEVKSKWGRKTHGKSYKGLM